MPEVDVSKKEKQYFADIPQQTPGFFLKGVLDLYQRLKNQKK